MYFFHCAEFSCFVLKRLNKLANLNPLFFSPKSVAQGRGYNYPVVPISLILLQWINSLTNEFLFHIFPSSLTVSS